MKNLILRLWFKLPRRIKNVWYVRYVYNDEHKYPMVFDGNKKFIRPELGLEVIMFESNKFIAYYSICKQWKTSGSDWLSDYDAINVDLKFSRIVLKP